MKKGDIVVPCDGSGVIGLGENGFDFNIHGIDINHRYFEILEINCNLPRRGFAMTIASYDNDTILKAIDNGQVIFIKQSYLKLKKEPIYVGDYLVKDVTTRGFHVGCQFVTWEKYDEIGKLRP